MIKSTALLCLFSAIAAAQEPQLAGTGRGTFTATQWDGSTNYAYSCANNVRHSVTNSAGTFTVADVCPSGDVALIRWCVAPPPQKIVCRLRTYLRDIETGNSSSCETLNKSGLYGWRISLGWTINGNSIQQLFYAASLTFYGATPPWCAGSAIVPDPQ